MPSEYCPNHPFLCYSSKQKLKTLSKLAQNFWFCPFLSPMKVIFVLRNLTASFLIKVESSSISIPGVINLSEEFFYEPFLKIGTPLRTTNQLFPIP